jgi:serine O-acetyltransferase
MNAQPDFSAIVPIVVQRALEYQTVLPSRADAKTFASGVLQALFPHFVSSAQECSVRSTNEQLQATYTLLVKILRPLEAQMMDSQTRTAEGVADAFFRRLPDMYEKLWLDADAIFQGDPAAYSLEEVILAYPGFMAIAVYRIAHEFYRLGVPLFPRLLAEYGHGATGVDIHPGASIGEAFCIDHGTGIVIGETTVIGRNVKIYQGVTLGALSVSKNLASIKRHPTIENNVVIYSNATILGGETVVGHDSVIGGNVWLTQSVPAHSSVYHTSEVRVRTHHNGQTRYEHVAEPIDFSI